MGYKVIGSYLQTVSAAAEKVCLQILCLVLGTKRCLETHDLRVPVISEKCSRLTN